MTILQKAKNYFIDAGDTFVVGGKIIFEEGVVIEGLEKLDKQTLILLAQALLKNIGDETKQPVD